jgi:putative acetyltransferase
MDIRPYDVADLDRVVTIWLESWRSTGIHAPVTWEELRTRFPQELAKGWEVHVAEESGVIVGFLALHGDTLEQLFITPERQSRGIGKGLLDFVKARRPGGFRLTTALDSRAGHFYRREGLTAGETGTHPRWDTES